MKEPLWITDARIAVGFMRLALDESLHGEHVAAASWISHFQWFLGAARLDAPLPSISSTQ